jgi:hypothetical protein
MIPDRCARSAHRHRSREMRHVPSKSLNDGHLGDCHRAVVNLFCPFSNICPAVHLLELGVRSERIVVTASNVFDGSGDGTDEILARWKG